MKRKAISGMMLTLLFAVSITFYMVVSVEAPTTSVSVINPETGDNNFIFYANETAIGTRFNATIWVYDVTDLFAYQVKLSVNDTLLNITNAWNPTWDSSWVFYGQLSVPLSPLFYDDDLDGVNEAVLIGASEIFGATPFTGTGILVIVEFEIIYAPISGSVSCSLDITDPRTFMEDSVGNKIPFTAIDGYYEFIAGPLPKKDTMVFFNINPNPTTAGETITLKGILVDENANPLGSETVKLYARPLAGPWKYIRSLTTNGYGIFTWQATIPSVTGTFIFAVYYPGSTTYESSYNFAILIIQ